MAENKFESYDLSQRRKSQRDLWRLPCHDFYICLVTSTNAERKPPATKIRSIKLVNRRTRVHLMDDIKTKPKFQSLGFHNEKAHLRVEATSPLSTASRNFFSCVFKNEFLMRDAAHLQNGWIFGRGRFLSKNLCCKTWIFKQGFFSMKMIKKGLFRLCFQPI